MLALLLRISSKIAQKCRRKIAELILSTLLKYPAFSKIDVYCPLDISEQQAIASYFTALDAQITLHRERLEKLKQIKAACLEKMFA